MVATDTNPESADAPEVKRKTLGERIGSDLSFLPVALGLVVLILFFATQSDVFLTSRNLNSRR